MAKKSKFTEREIETALRVVMESQAVRNWVTSEASFLGVDLNTPEGQEFYRQQSRAAAERIIK